jgi:hypothetical protein
MGLPPQIQSPSALFPIRVAEVDQGSAEIISLYDANYKNATWTDLAALV